MMIVERNMGGVLRVKNGIGEAVFEIEFKLSN